MYERVTLGTMLFSEYTDYTVERLTLPRARQFDAVQAGAPRRAVQWSWTAICKQSRDAWCLVDPDDAPASAFTSAKDRVMHYSLGPAYRLDYLEVRKAPRDPELGLLTVALMAARALDLGAETVSLGAIPATTPFWLDRVGGVQCDEQRTLWKPPLVPIVIPSTKLLVFARMYDEQCA